MDKIGIAVTGRNPGYTVFTKINWFGDEPKDLSMRSVCRDNTYISAVLSAQYDTYTLAICNFRAVDGRAAEVHIELRLPHGCAIVKDNGVESVVTVLRQVRKILEGEALLLFTDQYVLVDTPNFQEGKIAALLNSYVIKPAWNEYVTMADEAVGSPCYVATKESDVTSQLQSLLYSEQMRGVSMAFFGQFADTCRPVYTFTQEDSAQSRVRAHVCCRDGKTMSFDLLSGERQAEFRSTDFGYDQIAYTPVVCRLSSAAVLQAYYGGGRITFPGGRVELDHSIPAAKVRFEPSPQERVYFVSHRLIDKSGSHTFNPFDLRCKLLTGVFSPIKSAGYKFRGEEILNFERKMRNSAILMGEFDVCNKDFKIVGASLNGTQIEVTIEYVKPNVAPVSYEPPHVRAVEHATTTLHITVPAALAQGREVVVVQAVDQTGLNSITITEEIVFHAGRGDYKADMQIPVVSGRQTTGLTVQLGDIARARTHVARSKEGEYYANFAESVKTGAFDRYCQLFSFAHDLTLKAGSKCKRWLTLVAITIILLILGFLAGVIVSDILVKKGLNLYGILLPPAVENVATSTTANYAMPVFIPGSQTEERLQHECIESDEPMVAENENDKVN